MCTYNLTSNNRYFKLLQMTVKESPEKTVSLDTIAQQKNTTARIQKDTTTIAGWITLSNRYPSAHPEATEIHVQQTTSNTIGPLQQTQTSFGYLTNKERTSTGTGNVVRQHIKKRLGMTGVCRTHLGVPKLPDLIPYSKFHFRLSLPFFCFSF